jgi:membrane protein required for colicin V production
MNWLDIVLLLILAGSTVAGFSKGFTRLIIGIITLVAALVVSIWFYGPVASAFEPYLSSHTLACLLGFLVVFIGVNVLGGLVGMALARFLKLTGLSFFDHVLGAGFGLVRGVVFGIVLLMAVMAFAANGKPPEAVVKSRLAPHVVDASHVLANMAPYELKEGFRKSYDQVKSMWEQTLKLSPRPEKAKKNEREI